MSSSSQYPKYVTDLIDFYSTREEVVVFYEQVGPDADLEQVALKYYRQYVETVWDETLVNEYHNWMEEWDLLYTRPDDKSGDIVSEFKAVNDIYERILFALKLDDDESEIAEQKLAAAYDVPEVADLRIYQLSDVDIKTGRLIIGRRTNGETTVVVVVRD